MFYFLNVLFIIVGLAPHLCNAQGCICLNLCFRVSQIKVRALLHLATATQIFDVVSMSSEMGCIVTIQVFCKLTKLAIMAILTSEALLCEKYFAKKSFARWLVSLVLVLAVLALVIEIALALAIWS